MRDSDPAAGGGRVSISVSRSHSSPLRGSSGSGSSSDRFLSPREDSKQAQGNLSLRQLRPLIQNASSGRGANDASSVGGSSRLLRWTSGSEHAEPQPQPRAAQLPKPQVPSNSALKHPMSAAAGAAAAEAEFPAGPRRMRKSVSFADMPPPGSKNDSPPEMTAAAAAGLRRSVSQPSTVARSSNSSSLFDGLQAACIRGSLDSGLPRWEGTFTAGAATQQHQAGVSATAGKNTAPPAAAAATGAGADQSSTAAAPSWVPCLSDVSEELSQDGSSISSHHHSMAVGAAGLAADRALHSSGDSRGSSISSSLAALRVDNALSSSRLSAITKPTGHQSHATAAQAAGAALCSSRQLRPSAAGQ